jgi:hypothetical protein
MEGTWSSLARMQDRLVRILGNSVDGRSVLVGGMLHRNPSEATSYWLQLGVSIGIATLGLVVGSSAVVIGAMLVAPLLGPIVSLAMGLATGSPFLVLRSGGRIALSVIITVGGAALITVGFRRRARDERHRTARSVESEHRVARPIDLPRCSSLTSRQRAGGNPRWAAGNSLPYHNFWHLALYHIEEANYERAMTLFDEHIWPKPSAIALEMIDAASLLFRLHLRGLSLGARATSVADAWSDPAQRGYLAFNDVHAVMAMLADQRLDEARRIVGELERGAGNVDSNARVVRTVALPFARALIAFAEERYPLVIETLMPLRCIAHQLGGSNAQREIIEQVLGEAATRAGNAAVVRALAAERHLLRPQSGWARTLLARI